MTGLLANADQDYMRVNISSQLLADRLCRAPTAKKLVEKINKIYNK